jgi:hypothetical protein
VPESWPVSNAKVAHEGLFWMLKVSAIPNGEREVGRKLYAELAATVTAGLPETVGEVAALTLVVGEVAEASLTEPLPPEPPQPARAALMVNNPTTRPRNPQFFSMFMISRLTNRWFPVTPLSRVLSDLRPEALRPRLAAGLPLHCEAS